jgi:hypothetical protein
MQKFKDLFFGSSFGNNTNYMNNLLEFFPTDLMKSYSAKKKDPLYSYYETLILAKEIKKEIDNPHSIYNKDVFMKSISLEFYKMLEMFVACHSILWVIYAYQDQQRKKYGESY